MGAIRKKKTLPYCRAASRGWEKHQSGSGFLHEYSMIEMTKPQSLESGAFFHSYSEICV